jgi:hypothetical protein
MDARTYTTTNTSSTNVLLHIPQKPTIVQDNQKGGGDRNTEDSQYIPRVFFFFFFIRYKKKGKMKAEEKEKEREREREDPMRILPTPRSSY